MSITKKQLEQISEIADPLIKQRYLKYFQLPLDLQQIMFAVETADKIREIGTKNNLNSSRLGCVAHTIGLILLGETKIADFAKTLQEKCRLAEEQARQLARDINQEIFLPVKESLKKVHQIAEWPLENEKPSTVPPPASPSPASPPLASGPKINGNIVNLKQGQ